MYSFDTGALLACLFYLGYSPLNSGIACLFYAHPGIPCLASWASDWLGALWASLLWFSVKHAPLKLLVIGHFLVTAWLEHLASTSWLID